MEGLNSLKEIWSQLNLYEEEQDTIVIREDFPKEDQMKGKLRLIGKIYADRNIIKETI